MCCVVDALPETRKAKELRDRHRGRVFICYYVDTQKGDYKWNVMEGIVNVNRTESMDASQNYITSKELTINKNLQYLDMFASHCSNVARKIVTNEKTGMKTFQWIDVDADHFRHSYNYSCIASERIKFEQRIL